MVIHIHTAVKQGVPPRPECDAVAVRGVFPVGNHQVNAFGASQSGQVGAQKLAPGVPTTSPIQEYSKCSTLSKSYNGVAHKVRLYASVFFRRLVTWRNPLPGSPGHVHPDLAGIVRIRPSIFLQMSGQQGHLLVADL